MDVGFDSQNLAAAVALLRTIVKSKGDPHTVFGPELRSYDLSRGDQAKEYLIARAQCFYDDCGCKPTIAQVAGMAYFSIGIVFEEHLGEWGTLETQSAERPNHVAMFWQVL